jgi:hypothetical protein
MGIENVEYVGIIKLTDGYSPQRSCREHMLSDLPGVLRSPKGTLAHKIPQIVNECVVIAEDRLRRLPEGGIRLQNDEALAVVSYTYDLQWDSEEDGHDNLFVVLNNVLRMRSGPVMAALRPYLTYLMRGLQALPAVHTVCYRGVPPDCVPLVRAKYLLGSDVHWSAFTSCTPELRVAKQFAKQPGGVIFRVVVQTARDVKVYSACPYEHELLLSPNVKFVVTAACHMEADDYHYVDLLERRSDAVMF